MLLGAPMTLAVPAARGPLRSQLVVRGCCVLLLCVSGCFLDASGSPLEGGTTSQTGGTSSSGGAGGLSTSGGGGEGGAGGEEPAMDRSCPEGELATGLTQDGLSCEPVEQLALRTINGACTIHYGWADQCDACDAPPSKWGWVREAACETESADCSCQVDLLDEEMVQLLGLNVDGQVGEDDRFYTSLSCTLPEPARGPCGEPGRLLVGFDDARAPVCVDAGPALLAPVRSSCGLVSGWRDSCGGCDSPPSKWGRSTSVDCDPGNTEDNRCSTPTLGADTVSMLSLDTDGIVNDNDKFYLGLSCDDVSASESEARDECPAGSFVTGVKASGLLQCQSVEEVAVAAFRAHCRVYFGWRDLCDGGCMAPPSKWGWAADGDCGLGAGAQNTCVSATLGEREVELIGINTGAGVDGNDKFYVGFQCR